MKQTKEKVTDAPPVVLAAAEPAAAVHETPVVQHVHSQDILTVKDTPSQYGTTHRFNCLHKLAPNEPFFVLRAQDLLAPHLVEQWAMNAEKAGCDPAKVREARQTALQMMCFRGRKYPD